MRLTPARALLIGALLAPLAACRDVPLEPLTADVAAGRFDEAGLRTPAPWSADAMVRAAVTRLHRDEGAAAAQRAVSGVRRLHDALVHARLHDAELIGRLEAELRSEKLDLVLRLTGDAAVPRVLDGVAHGIGRVRAEAGADHGNGLSGGGSAAALADADRLLARARAAHHRRDARGALDLATQAAESLDEARRAIVAAHRITGLDALYRQAIELADDGAALEAGHQRLIDAARDATRNGSRGAAQTRLEAARDEQLRIVLRVLGEDVALRALADAGRAHALVGADVEAARARGIDTDPHTRMLRSAGELLERARRAARERDMAAALDLTSHAAGLIDALRLSLAGSF